MTRLRLDRDLEPVTGFRARVAAVIERVRRTRRPVLLTQHGRGAAVLVDVQVYERMQETLERIGEPRASARIPAHDPVAAYKGDVDRSLLRANRARTASERLRRLSELGNFASALREAGRRAAATGVEPPEAGS